MTISGNIESLRQSTLDEIEALYDLKLSRNEFLTAELTERLASLTDRINREIAVYINRKGAVTEISIGDSSTVNLMEVEGRRGTMRLSGVRCIHTHPNGDARLSAVDINSLLHLNLDAMAAIGTEDGKVTGIFVALPSEGEGGERTGADIHGPFRNDDPRLDELMEMILERDRMNTETVSNEAAHREKAILVGLETSSRRQINGKSEGERSLDELEELSNTAGLVVLEKVLQRKPVKDAAYLVGRGKIEEISLLRQALDADVLVFDEELSGAQIRNIEQATGAKVVDRTTLILDIFAQRAHSSEGKLQVELAQLRYRLPRLIGLGGQLSRLGGGIGTRGPGEKKLETDRRHIRRRVSSLEEELGRLGVRRGLMREGRKQADVPVVALVGYTNAGKSTLMNTLCGVDVFAENKLFATLDPTTRKLPLPDGRQALLVDTVGFIRKLPHELVEAFKSTMEEAVYADLLLHVVDAADEEAEEHMPVVETILQSLGAVGKPTILVLNKTDLIGDERRVSVTSPADRVVEASAVTGKGLDILQRHIIELLPSQELEAEVLAPYTRGWVLPYLHENGKVLREDYREDGVYIKVKINKIKIEKVREFVLEPTVSR